MVNEEWLHHDFLPKVWEMLDNYGFISLHLLAEGLHAIEHDEHLSTTLLAILDRKDVRITRSIVDTPGYSGSLDQAETVFASEIGAPRASIFQDKIVETLTLREVIDCLVSGLTEREREVLSLRYGLGGEPEHSLGEVGQSFGVTRERARQIEATALHKLRQSPHLVMMNEWYPIAIKLQQIDEKRSVTRSTTRRRAWDKRGNEEYAIEMDHGSPDRSVRMDLHVKEGRFWYHNPTFYRWLSETPKRPMPDDKTSGT